MNRRTKIGIVIVVSLLLVAAVTVYIARKPVYDSYEKFSTTPATTITLDLSQGSGTYSSGGTTQPLRVTVTPPTLSEIANSSSSSALVVARISGGPLGLVPAVVQFNGSALSLWWPVVSPYGARQQNLLPSVTYTGPGTYSGVFGSISTTLVIGDEFPCLSGNLSIDLSDTDNPKVVYNNTCGTNSSFSGNAEIFGAENNVIGTFSNKNSGNLQSISVEYSNNSVQVVVNPNGSDEIWLSSSYTGPGNYSSKVMNTSISLVLGQSFPDPVCIGQSDGYVCGTTRYGAAANFINVNKACITGKCVDCTQNTSSICRQALQSSCEKDKVACDDQPCTGQDPEDCANEKQSCIQMGAGLFNHFGVSC